MYFRRGDRSLDAIAYRIRVIAAANGLSQRRMAQRLGLGANTVNQWWKAKERPALDYAWRIVDEFRVDLNFIYEGVDDALAVRIRDELASATKVLA